MKNVPLLLGTIFLTIVMIVVVAFLFSGDGATNQPAITVPAGELIPASPHVKGATESATVTIVEFSDLQCPACKAVQPMIEQVLAQYPDDVQLIYRHFPLDSIHPNARAAAAAAEVAALNGKFWQMHDLLFARQLDWEGSRNRSELYETFAGYAEELEIDKTEFLEKIEADDIKAKVQEDAAAAARLGIAATPTFFVNGQQTPAPQLMSTVESLVTGASEAPEQE